MSFEQYGGYAKLGYEIARHWTASADANVTHFNASCPGPVWAPLVDGDQRITRGVASLAFANEYERTSGALSLFYNWGRHRINDGYTPSTGESPQQGRFNSRDDMTGVSVYQSMRLFEGGRLTLGFDWFRYGGRAWTEYVAGEQAGTSRDIVDKHEDELAGYIDLRQHVTRWLTIDAGIRLDSHSRVGEEWVPQAGLAFHLPHAVELKASVSKGFRYPIIREMYMFGAANPDLAPESMWNYEIALSQLLAGGRVSYGVNIFYIDGKNLIQTLPNPSGSGMLNQNSGRVENCGVEVQAAWRVSDAWSVDANYGFLHMEHPVIAAPEHKLHVGAGFSKGRWSVSSGVAVHSGALYLGVACRYRALRPVERARVAACGTQSRFMGARREPAGREIRDKCRIPDAARYGFRRSERTFLAIRAAVRTLCGRLGHAGRRGGKTACRRCPFDGLL